MIFLIMNGPAIIRWLKRRIDKGLIICGVMVFVCCLHAYRVATHDEFFVFTIRKCLYRKTAHMESAGTDEFFKYMWSTLPSVVGICSLGMLHKRIDTFVSDGFEVKFLSNCTYDPQDHCDIVFVTDDGDLSIPLQMRHAYNDCRIHSSSEVHRGIPHKPTLDIVTYPYNVKPGGGLKEDLFEDIGLIGDNSVNLVTLLSSFVRKYRVSSLVINKHDSDRFVPLFFSRGIFEQSYLITCQLNIVYPKPRTYKEKLDFRIAWIRLLEDRRYLIQSISRTKDKLNIFLISISDGYCWKKFLSKISPNLVKF